MRWGGVGERQRDGAEVKEARKEGGRKTQEAKIRPYQRMKSAKPV